jgi:hypothetical protein
MPRSVWSLKDQDDILPLFGDKTDNPKNVVVHVEQRLIPRKMCGCSGHFMGHLMG